MALRKSSPRTHHLKFPKMPPLAIVFAHHGLDGVAGEHLQTFREQNPEATVLPVSYADRSQSAEWEQWIEPCRTDRQRAWAECDLLLYRAYAERTRDYERWLFVEWDTFCAMPVTEFFRETWHFDAVGGTICLPDREPEWRWFRDGWRLPEPLRRLACGMKPASVSLFSSRALAAMTAEFLKSPFSACVELRLGTLASACGFLPVPNPRSNATVSWRERPSMVLRDGIFHPVKTARRPQTVWRLFAVLCHPTPLLPHFLEHYSALGFTDLHLAVHRDCPEVDWDALRRRCKARLHVEEAFAGSYHCFADTAIINGLKARYVADGEWSAAADLDEFYEYPEPLEVIAGAAGNANCMVGRTIDRRAKDGVLRAVRDGESVFEQFPMEDELTKNVAKASTRKIMLMRGPYWYSPGHHALQCPREQSEIAHAREGRVHHFKWHAGLVEYLEKRLSTEDLAGQKKIREELMRLQKFVISIASVENGLGKY